MKKLVFLLVLSLWAISAFAQDVIVKRDATKIEAVIIEVSDSEIRYKNHSNQAGPTFVIKTDDVSTIMYKNGDVQVFEKKAAPVQQNANSERDSRGNSSARLSLMGGYFYLGDKMMSQDEGRYFLMKNCTPAYQQYKMYSDLGYTGVAFLSVGSALMLSGGIIFAVHDQYQGFCIMMSAVASIGVGIPLCAAGFACRDKACFIYNERCANTASNRNKGIRLDLQSSRDGIGLALKF